MQVLLPDFALHPPQQIGTPFRHSKKTVLNQRSKTAQIKRSQFVNSQRIKYRQKSQNVLRKQNLSIFIPFSSREQKNLKSYNLSSSQFATVNFQSTMQQQPIHSRKSNRFINNSLAKRKISPKKVTQRSKQTIIPIQFSFLMTKKVASNRKSLYNPEYQSQVIKKPKHHQNYFNRFPTKKVKSAFIIEQYRPWSPKKGQSTFDYQITS